MRLKATSLFVSLMLVVAAPSAFADEGDEGDDGASKASDRKIELIADFVAGGDEALTEAATTSVTDLRTSGIGWGALLEIYKLADAMDMDPASLIAIMGEDGGFAFGKWRKALTDDERAAYEDMPKNFGTLKAAEMKAEKAKEREERKAEKKAERDARKEARDAAKADRKADQADGGTEDADADEDSQD